MFGMQTPLQLALSRGMQPGGKLGEELERLGDFSVKSRRDALAICQSLQRLNSEGPDFGGDFALHALTGLFQDVENAECPAFSVLADQGVPVLGRFVEDAIGGGHTWDHDQIMFVLKILAMYGTAEGTDVLIRAARRPFEPGGYMWNVILRAFNKNHPQSARLFASLSDPLPPGFLAISLLDAANICHMEGVEWPHPFDSPQGWGRLESWLRDTDPDHFSYARSATNALPFISGRARDNLLTIALDHPAVEVQLEGAWAAGKLGREAGIRLLSRHCLDVKTAESARRLLEDLGREDAIPREADDPGFKAKSHFTNWLCHPNELGHPPDEVWVVDHRVLSWPLEREPTRLWLVGYRVRDKTGLEDDDEGVGMVGSITFCLFSYDLIERPPADRYAIHCYWEMEHKGLISEEKETGREYDSLLAQWTGGNVEQPKVTHVAEISPELNYPQRLVGAARGRVGGNEGTIILDGTRSRFYPDDDFPADPLGTVVLHIHIGRTLLGLGHSEPDRKRFLKPPRPRRSPRQIVDAYESLLATASAAGPSNQQKLLDNFSPLGTRFDEYVDALLELNRQSDVPALIEKFRPYWQHNLGYGALGAAAYRAGHDVLAESFFLQLRDSYEDWWRGEEVDYLATIWHRQGRFDDARELLFCAMRVMQNEAKTATGSDRGLTEEWFQNHRRSFIRLFPDQPEAALAAAGITASTLPTDES